jgi:FixJ family two-component response regulator
VSGERARKAGAENRAVAFLEKPFKKTVFSKVLDLALPMQCIERRWPEMISDPFQ